MFYKVDVGKILQISQENTCVRVFCLQLQPDSKRDSSTVVFLLILRKLEEQLFIEHLWATASESTNSICYTFGALRPPLRCL